MLLTFSSGTCHYDISVELSFDIVKLNDQDAAGVCAPFRQCNILKIKLQLCSTDKKRIKGTNAI